ncbi:hypothetical protein YC2023_104505 [Brassica napus]
MTIEKVVVHPLVLRNIFHKHHCVVKNTGRRGVGVLLGWRHRGIVSVTNSYAVLFKEDSICTSPEPHVNNLDIHAVFRKYAHDPLFLTIDVMRTEIPTAAYLAVDEVNEVGSSKKTFFRVFTTIAPPPEEIGTSTRSTLVSEMPIAGALPDMIESHYLFVKNKVCISVEGYDLSLDHFDLDRSLEEHFGSCGTVEYVDV